MKLPQRQFSLNLGASGARAPFVIPPINTQPYKSPLLMKRTFSPRLISRLLLLSLGSWLGSSAAFAATLSVNPSSISNQYAGLITLAITGLTNLETVTLDKFLDANTNGVIDGGDLLMQRFQLTDNLVSLIGGATNVNVPSDSNPASSDITTRLNFERIDVEHIVGSYLFKLTSPSARFTPVTTTFNITNSAYLQSFTGQVCSNGTATAVANAIVVLLGTNTDGNNFVGGTVANNAGNYSFKVAPGSYQLAAFKSNFVGDFTVSAVAVNAGATVATNVNAIPATQTISGRVADAANTNTPLPGILMFLESAGGFFALSFTDTNGNFSAPVTATSWQISPQGQDAALHGFVSFQDAIPVDTTTGNVANVKILLPKGTAMIYGSIKDVFGNPFPGADVFGEDRDTYQYESDSVSDANGSYAVAALAGNWSANLSNDDPRLTNYVYSGNGVSTLLVNGQSVRHDFILQLATNHITGYVRDNLNNPITGVGVSAYANINGTNFSAGNALTDGNGNYILNVVNGTWGVGVSCGCNDCSDSLSGRGYQCVNNQNVNILNGNGVANFIAQPCSPLQVTTTSLPNATVGSFYNFQLQAAACDQSFTWSLSPGSAALPAGLNLDSGGNLSGTPNSSGPFNFSVRVTDNTLATADQALTLTILPPLRVTTSSLPSGTNGAAYNAQLQASGGQQPYYWSLASGSLQLPLLLNLNSNGSITGTPVTNGTFQFTAQVIDGSFQNVAYSNLSITIAGSSSPLQVTTTSLPNGTLNTFYSQPVNGSGGQTPYTWSLAPGSAPLPPGLNLTSGGTLSGTPTNTGTFYFYVRATDALSAMADGLLSIYIPTPPLQITTLTLPNAQQGASYTNQLQASGGQLPYIWSLAPGSLNLPPNLNLSASGIISGTAATNGTYFFIVRVTDGNATLTNRSLSLTINPKPTLTALSRAGNQFQMRLTGATGQTYTVQYSTNLANTNWLLLLSTNPSAPAVTILDPSATNSARFYRARVGP